MVVFLLSQATVLIETLPGAFEMDEILFELREHSAGLNCGRWDYIFSFIKTLRGDPNAVMPDRCHMLHNSQWLLPHLTCMLEMLSSHGGMRFLAGLAGLHIHSEQSCRAISAMHPLGQIAVQTVLSTCSCTYCSLCEQCTVHSGMQQNTPKSCLTTGLFDVQEHSGHDSGLLAVLQSGSHSDLPQAGGACHGWHGCPDPHQE